MFLEPASCLRSSLVAGVVVWQGAVWRGFLVWARFQTWQAGIKSSDEMFIALMRSQSVQSALIEQFKLKERYGAQEY
jgi:hypothetical protein